MSWTDKKSLVQFTKLRDLFDIKIFVETGTFRGVNAAVHANNFDTVITCEVNKEYYYQSFRKLIQYNNIKCVLDDSPSFLSNIKGMYTNEMIFIYLDAHFYNPLLNKEDRWVVLKELKALKGMKNCIIAIHDFDCNGLGHLVYDGQPLNFDLIKNELHLVNENFNYYCNTKETCDILTVEDVKSNSIPNLVCDEYIEDNLRYAWSNETKTYRGILYCIPEKLDLNNFELVQLI